nr:NAD(P)-binding Rossmann-fold superfamily protein [Tanacetum cinerariifolium]
MGVHYIAVLRMMVGCEVASVSAMTSHVDTTLPPPDTISCIFQLDNGCSGVFVIFTVLEPERNLLCPRQLSSKRVIFVLRQSCVIIYEPRQEEDGRKHNRKGSMKSSMMKRALKASGQTDLSSNASKDILLMHRRLLSLKFPPLLLLHLSWNSLLPT